MSNKVELIGVYGGDESIALSAWTSTSRNLSEEKRNRIGKMVQRLWMDHHKSPFEKCVVHFLVTCDQASHIHLLKHRIASINGESARYKELKEDKFIIPNDWHGNENLEHWSKELESATISTNQKYHECLRELTPILGRKRAKESARYFKMFNSQIQLDVMFNISSFANFYELRNSEHAQLEIQEIAQEMMYLLEATGEMPNAIEAIKKNKSLNETVHDAVRKYGYEKVLELLGS